MARRLALITGGAGGLGAATAECLASDGVQVVLADFNLAAAKGAAAKLPGTGHMAIELDVSSESSVAEGFARVENEAGPIAILVHFAGVLGSGGAATGIHLADSTLDDWERVFAVNSRGTFLCLREMARHRRVHPVAHGRIVTVSSLAGQIGGLQAGVAYSASKGAVLALTKSAARGLASQGINVNAIAPGPIDTVMHAQALGSSTASAAYSIPVGRIGTPAEVAAAVRYLVSEEAAFVTGHTIDVNGGLSMR